MARAARWVRNPFHDKRMRSHVIRSLPG
jgi:hypothetical protein